MEVADRGGAPLLRLYLLICVEGLDSLAGDDRCAICGIGLAKLRPVAGLDRVPSPEPIPIFDRAPAPLLGEPIREVLRRPAFGDGAKSSSSSSRAAIAKLFVPK